MKDGQAWLRRTAWQTWTPLQHLAPTHDPARFMAAPLGNILGPGGEEVLSVSRRPPGVSPEFLRTGAVAGLATLLDNLMLLKDLL